MITLEPDFNRETENIFWESIEEILRDTRIINAYDKLHLLRLNNFIEDQLTSRKFQVRLYLSNLKFREVCHSSEISIQKRIKDINLIKGNPRFEDYLSISENEIIQKEMLFLLRNTSQYVCNFNTLTFLKKTINIILNRDKPTKRNHEEIAAEAKEPEQKYNCTYLKNNGKRFTHFQIALFAYFKNYKIRDPKSDDNNTLENIAEEDFGYDSDNSAQKIYDKYYNQILISNRDEKELKLILETLHLKTKVSYRTIKKYIEEIIPLLEDSNHKEEAKKHIDQLKFKID